MLALIALWLAISLYFITRGMSVSQTWDDVMNFLGSIRFDVSQLLPDNRWLAVLIIGLLLALAPWMLAKLLDGKGQSASGWLWLIGTGFSIAAVTVFLVVYLGGTVIYLIGDLIFG